MVRVARSANAQMGTLIRKSQRQPAYSVISPLSKGAEAIPIPPTTPHAPIIVERRRGSGIPLVRIASVIGTTKLAPTPCAMRATIRVPAVSAAAQATEAARNASIDQRYTLTAP